MYFYDGDGTGIIQRDLFIPKAEGGETRLRGMRTGNTTWTALPYCGE